MPRPKKPSEPKRVTRYIYDDVTDPASPETGHTPQIPDETVVELPMDNGWTGGLEVGKLPDDGKTVILDMDPSVDPVLMWAGKRNRREVPLLPLQRTEIVSESRIARIIERAREAAAKDQPQFRQESLFAELEKELRESDKDKRVEFYTHEEGWKNKLICGDSLQVMESLIHYEGLRGKVQMIYIDPPYGIKYDSNFQQRVDSTKNDEKDQADDVLSIRAFRDTWSLGIHSYLEYLKERLYLCRELLADAGSVFVQISDDNVHRVRALMDEVFGAGNFMSLIAFAKTAVADSDLLPVTHDFLIWYARDKTLSKYRKLWRERVERTEGGTFTWVELPSGECRRLTSDERTGEMDLPEGSLRFRAADVSSQGETVGGSEPVEFEGKTYRCSPGRHWKRETVERLIAAGRIVAQGSTLAYKRYEDDFPWMPFTHVWNDTIIGTFTKKHYVVQTNERVVERCIAMTTDPGDIVFDPTCGSGTTALCAEKLGRRWVTCDTSRVAVNVARQRLLSATFEHYTTRNGSVSSGFVYKTVDHVTLKGLAYDLEPEKVELVDQPEVDKDAIRVCGPLEVMTLGRYSIEDWRGQLVTTTADGMKLEDYIAVICRLYRKDASLVDSVGVIHAVVDREGDGPLGITVGPISGRVTARQLSDAAREAKDSGIAEVHVLGWAFEANVGEVKERLAHETGVTLELVMIRPDTLAEGLKVTQPEMLFSPLALPDVDLDDLGNGEFAVTLKGVAVFDRKTRVTEYKHADSGYVAAWYLDEDYDGDCFVDCQMFFDFKKKPAIERTLKIEVDPEEWTLRLTSDPFKAGTYRQIAVKVVDVFGNESTVVKALG
jgi:adenine-specific DNA-methyltransferase